MATSPGASASVAEGLSTVDVRFGWRVESLAQTDDGVTLEVVDPDGDVRHVSADWVVGADGGASTVRKALGIELRGDSNLGQQRQSLFYSDTLFDRIRAGKGKHYHVADEQIWGIVVQDDCKHFSMHVAADATDDEAELLRRVIGDNSVDFELISASNWTMRLMVADRYRDGRVFLAGDSAHLVIPTGGLGMNTGIGDAIDIAWKLEHVVKGFAPAALLDTYELERRAIGKRNVGASKFAFQGRTTWRRWRTPALSDDTDEGRARAELVEVAETEQRKSNSLLGIEAGYRYRDSPIVIDDGRGGAPGWLLRVSTFCRNWIQVAARGTRGRSACPRTSRSRVQLPRARRQ